MVIPAGEVRRVFNEGIRRFESMPFTFFYLNGAEKKEYHKFLVEYEEHKVNLSRAKKKHLRKEERERGFEKLRKGYLGLLESHFEDINLDIEDFFLFYGRENAVYVNTPMYTFFPENPLKGDHVRAGFLFSNNKNEISCRSHLEYFDFSLNSEESHHKRGLVYDAFYRMITDSNKKIFAPYLIDKSDYLLFFALSNQASLVIGDFKGFINLLGEQLIHELSEVRKVYTSSVIKKPNEDQAYKNKILGNAYQLVLKKAIKEKGIFTAGLPKILQKEALN